MLRRDQMDKNKAEAILTIAAQVLKLQEEFKNITGTAFNISQNLVDSVNYSQGFLAALRSTETPKMEVAKDESADKLS